MVDKVDKEEQDKYNLNEALDDLDHSTLFRDNLTKMSGIIGQTAITKGFWEGQFNPGEKLALIHSEVSEALEEFRKPNPNMTNIGEELADIVIRCMDIADHLGEDIGNHILSNMRKNITRPRKHGKQF